MIDKILLEEQDFLNAALEGDNSSRKLLIAKLDEYLHSSNHEIIRDFFMRLHPADSAQVIEFFSPEKACALIKFLDIEDQARIFNYLPANFEARMAKVLGRRDLAKIVSAMSHDERADLFNRLSPEQQEEILPALAQAEREDIRKLSSYAENTAGAVMTSDYCALQPDISASQAIDKLRREAPDKETIYQSFVIDKDRRLLGVVSLRELLVASPSVKVKDIMNAQPIFGSVNDEAEEIAETMSKYDLLAMPIINGNDKLVGIVTFDDVHDIIEEEATEDFHKMGSISGHGESITGVNFLQISPWLLIQKRLPWLIALVFVNLLSGAGIAFYEDTIQAVVALVFFLPLLIASGGNAGAQSATLMVRAIATGDVHAKDWMRLLGREVGIALILGGGMALAVSLIGVYRGGPEVAIVVALTMLAVVIFGSLVGCLLPFLLTRFKMDPATASAPLITSIADVGGILIYFSIATWILNIHAPV
ncbi:magnesium transporter [Desulfonatronovibrio magnus]|uniref:magnesium transporter n=1 Tax=Desulfonatronovibrio magnus TaxID=698827 RepID=UPI000A0656D6|nr:magnesium transporter [Desulfonatronovibrio magnus]